VLTAAALCPAPPLLARELTGADPVVPELRQACRDAAGDLVAGRPDLIAVVGAAATTREHDPAGWLDLRPYAPGPALAHPPPDAARGPALPLPLGLGARLLDEAGYRGPRLLQAVGAAETPAACAALGAALAGAAPRVAMLVLGEGSARRTRKAPGALDCRAAPFDAVVSRAIAAGQLAGLLTIDPALAADLLAAGRPGWQVLAGAAAGQPVTRSVIRYEDDPFGVAYLVASLTAGPVTSPA
jgi:hypothetical protein